jgi:hypothetical protein
VSDCPFDDGDLARLQGVKLVERLQPLLARLRGAACHRDRAGNRQLFYDQLCGLILLTFFNPSLTTLRDLQQASRLQQVRRKLGCSRASMGSLSEAMHVFEPELLAEIAQELLAQVPQWPAADPRLKELGQVITNVDSTLLLKLPQVTQACFAHRADRGWRLHTHFEVLRGVPVLAQVTDASGKKAAGEKAMLKQALQPGRCYVMDRGYEEFSLFNQIVAADSSYVCRIRNDHRFQATTVADPTPEAQAAGVLEDAVGHLGSPKSLRIEHPDHPVRRVVVRVTEHLKRGGRRRRGATQELVLATNLVDVPVEIVVLLYRFRWLIELFFRWLKCVLNCRHLLSQDPGGIQIQMYCALIACLLIQLACPFKPNQWTYKLLCLYQQGWVTDEELAAHFQERAAASQKLS